MNYTVEEKAFLELTRLSLKAMGKEKKHREKLPVSPQQLEPVLDMARGHAVLSFCHDLLSGQLSGPLWERVDQAAVRTVQQSYHLLLQTRAGVFALEEAGISVVVLKGVAAAEFYPVPELRKSGDIDLLLLDPQDLKRAEAVLLDRGWGLLQEQTAEHHVAFRDEEGIELELHTMLAEPFDNRRMNRYLEGLLGPGRIVPVRREIMGVSFPVLPDGLHAFELLLHMLQHFLRSGFGVKLLCDWVEFWNRPVEKAQIRIYEQLVRESRIQGFSDMVTSACVRTLGLSSRCCLLSVKGASTRLLGKSAVCAFMKEILEAEEFGRSERERMVVMRSSGLWGYVREFHHQMGLNYPRAGRVVVIWPVLWLATLSRFIRNNRSVRGGISTREILKKADDRSRVMEEIRLFQPRK